MLEQEFDRFAQEYEQLHASVLTASGEGPAFFAAYKPADMRRHLAAAGVSRGPLTLLDFGCGGGSYLCEMAGRGWQVTGLDVSPQVVRSIQEQLGFEADLHRNYVSGVE